MFGKSAFGTGTSTAFGTGSSLFGTSSKPTGGFSNQQMNQSSSIFGQKPLFGSSTPTQQTSLFGSTQPASSGSSSLFGQPKTLFGTTTTASTGFGGSSSLFSTPQSSTQSAGLFGGTFGASNIGTTVKFEPTTSADTMVRNGTTQAINTKHVCITAMKHYDGKSMEELRCEDYIANRKGPKSSGLSFGQTNQPSTSGLFSTSTTSTQSSIFGANKSLFGNASSSFGSATTSTPSLFGSQQNAGSSLFGPKKPGLFGNTTTSTASPFGQTQQTGTGLFGAKSTSGFGGTQQTSLFGGTSTFGSTASTSSPFSFGTTSTTVAPFGQAQPAASGFGFSQPASSTSSTGLFGAKPATSGFGSFGTAPATSTFGNQQTTGGLFGSKPTTGGLFGSNTGSLFGNTTTSAPTLFGSTTAAKPNASLFGSTTGQTAFGAQAPVAAATIAAPIVLGADVNQTLLQNALIEAQIAASPYGDSPLLKLVSKDVSEKSDITNPISVERQMRFLASKKEKGANTTTVNGPSALGSIPAAGLPISIPSYNKSRASVGNFAYRPVFSPPALKNRVMSPIVNLNTSLNKSSLLNGSGRDDSVAALLEQSDGDLILQNRRPSNVKRLDLSLLHKSMQENKNRSSQQFSSMSPTTHFNKNRVSSDSGPQNTDFNQEKSPLDKRGNESVSLSNNVGGSSQLHSPVRGDSETDSVAERSQVSLSKDRNLSSTAAERSSQIETNKTTSKECNNSVTSGRGDADSPLSASALVERTAGIKLTRPDYECEPSLKELAIMAERDGGVCHISDGFTVRRLAYGSVFWPGPFDLSNVDLDEIVHFRQHEVTVYPDDDKKPPIGEGLNRFAEVSLERVWPVDKKTKEIIKDPLRIERCGFRAKLERCCASMSAKFKDYRSETGTWVFTVAHFTKYGLLDDSDEEMPSPEQIRASKLDNRIQSAVQRARPYLGLSNSFNVSDINVATSADDSIIKKTREEFYGLKGSLDISTGGLHSAGTKGLGGFYGSSLDFTQTTVGSFAANTSVIYKGDQNTVSGKCFDSSLYLDSILQDSKALEARDANHSKCVSIEVRAVEPLPFLPYVDIKHSVITKFFPNKVSRIDGGIFQGKRARIGWGSGIKYAHSALPSTFSVVIRQLLQKEENIKEYLSQLLDRSIQLSSGQEAHLENDGFDDESCTPSIKLNFEASVMVNDFIEISERCQQYEDLKVWRLCKALFTDESHINVKNVKLKKVLQRERLGEWLKNIVAAENKDNITTCGSSQIFNYLCNGDLQAAVKEAIASKRYLLAIALATFQHSPRSAYKKQIDYWVRCGATEFIDEDLLKICLLMAGIPSVEVQGREIYVIEGLHWTQALGLYLWYYCNAETTIAEALQAFENELRLRGDTCNVLQSVYFGLIKLACDKEYSLTTLLEPTAFTVNCFDYHLSWHLLCLLDSLGFKNITDSAHHIVHVGYAEQLSELDLNSFAVFVLMHIRSNSGRHNAVSEMVDRFAGKVMDDEQWEILTKLNVPKEVISHSRFLCAKNDNDFIGMCRYALEAKLFDEAHRLFVDKVGPFAVTNDEIELLKEFCESFEQESSFISKWGFGGQVYADFYHLREALRRVKEDSEVDELTELAHSLEPRLSCMEPKTNLERLSVAVMSRLVYEVVARFEGIELPTLPLALTKAVDIASSSAYSAINIAN